MIIRHLAVFETAIVHIMSLTKSALYDILAYSYFNEYTGKFTVTRHKSTNNSNLIDYDEKLDSVNFFE